MHHHWRNCDTSTLLSDEESITNHTIKIWPKWFWHLFDENLPHSIVGLEYWPGLEPTKDWWWLCSISLWGGRIFLLTPAEPGPEIQSKKSDELIKFAPKFDEYLIRRILFGYIHWSAALIFIPSEFDSHFLRKIFHVKFHIWCVYKKLIFTSMGELILGW